MRNPLPSVFLSASRILRIIAVVVDDEGTYLTLGKQFT